MLKALLVVMLLPATLLAGEACPKSGFHLGKDVSGKKKCIRNGNSTCPKGFTQQNQGDNTFQCASQRFLKGAQQCGKGEREWTDKAGLRRCVMENYDKCPDGFHVGSLGQGKFSCVSDANF